MEMIMRPIFPKPVSLTRADGCLRLTLETRLTVAPGTLSAASKLEFSSLWNRFTLTLGRLVIEENAALLPFQGVIGSEQALTCPDGEDYMLTVTEQGASLAARDTRGFCHALTSLLQMIVPLDERTFALPCVRIADHPKLAVRMIHLCVFPETTLPLLEKAIRLAAFMKYTHVILEFWGMFRYRCMASLSWPDVSFTAEQLRPLIALIRSLGMEPVPMLNHLGHATQARECYGRHVVLDQDPTKGLLFEPDGWTWCLSNPDALALLRAMRNELIDLFGPGSYFHLGCDESRSFATCPRCREHEQHELLASYLNGLAEELGQQGRRPIIWGDQLLESARWRGTTPGLAISQMDGQTTHLAIPLLDRRIVIADWHYGVTTPDLPTSRFFKEEGFDVLTCPWDIPANIAALGQAACDQNLPGIIATTWDHLPDYLKKIDMAASMAWCGKIERCISPHTEIASLLRRVMPYPHAYVNAGWNSFEVNELGKAIKDL